MKVFKSCGIDFIVKLIKDENLRVRVITTKLIGNLGLIIFFLFFFILFFIYFYLFLFIFIYFYLFLFIFIFYLFIFIFILNRPSF